MKAVILNVGDEVLEGKVINTNSSFLTSSLLKTGIKTKRIVVVGDDEEMLREEIIAFQKSDADLLITTGGLGPTHDDFTKEVLASTLKKKMVINHEAKKVLDNYFKDKYAECNLKQAYFPEGAIIIPNNNGTADGAIIEDNKKIYIILVGPPFEMKPMVDEVVLPYLKRINNLDILINEYLVMGIGESDAEELLLPLIKKYQGVNIAPYASIGKIRYQITADKLSHSDFEKANFEFVRIMKQYIISSTVNNKPLQEIEEVVVKKLKNLSYHISFGESCTGGMLASSIINVSGASSVLNESFVTYSNEAKIKYLHVEKDTIKLNGVVSSEVVKEMALGLRKLTNSEVCCAVSGIVGPSGGTSTKPVGLVHYAIMINDEIFLDSKIFKGSREQVRLNATLWILYKINELLEKM